MQKVGRSLDRVGRRAVRVGRRFKAMGQSMSKAGKNLSLKMTLPLKLLGILTARTAIKFESAFTGVKKTVTATAQQFAVLRAKLAALALKIPVSTENLFRLAEAGGQLGIQRKNLVGFVKTMADLAATTNLTVEEGAPMLARFANIVQMNQKHFGRLGAVVVDLGNNLATTEAEIVSMGLRLAGAGNLVGLTESQILGLAGGLTSLGINAEAGGTAFSQVMRKMDKAIGTGSKEMKGFAWVLGTTVKGLKKDWGKDAAGVLLKFVERLGGVEKRGYNVNLILDALGMEGLRISDSLLRASGSGDLLRKSMTMGSRAWKENIALVREANLRYSTSESKLKIFWNRVKQLAASIGKVFLPTLIKLVDWLSPFVDKLKESSPATKKIILILAALAAAAGPLLFIISQLTIAFAGIAVALPVIGGAILPVTIAIAGLAAAAYLVIKHWSKIKPFMKKLLGWMKAQWDLLVKNIQDAVDFMLDLLPDFLKRKLGIAIPAPELKPQYRPRTPVEKQFEKEIGRQRDLISSVPSGKIDLGIKLWTEEGTGAAVASVKKSGNIDPDIISETYTGPLWGLNAVGR